MSATILTLPVDIRFAYRRAPVHPGRDDLERLVAEILLLANGPFVGYSVPFNMYCRQRVPVVSTLPAVKHGWEVDGNIFLLGLALPAVVVYVG